MRFLQVFIILLFTISASSYAAEDIYQSPEAFIAQSFEGEAIGAETFVIPDDLKPKISKIMGSYYRFQPLQYWKNNGRSAWILEDIGKYEPITAGFVVGQDAKLERVKVLVYRESHGWEVKHNFFTRQFKGAGLRKEKKLDQRIDGISGATLSVNALKRMSALALLLHREVMADEAQD